jgi:hypothetical protein
MIEAADLTGFGMKLVINSKSVATKRDSCNFFVIA